MRRSQAAGEGPWDRDVLRRLLDRAHRLRGQDTGERPFWGYALNYRPLEVGGCQQQVGARRRSAVRPSTSSAEPAAASCAGAATRSRDRSEGIRRCTVHGRHGPAAAARRARPSRACPARRGADGRRRSRSTRRGRPAAEGRARRDRSARTPCCGLRRSTGQRRLRRVRAHARSTADRGTGDRLRRARRPHQRTAQRAQVPARAAAAEGVAADDRSGVRR